MVNLRNRLSQLLCRWLENQVQKSQRKKVKKVDKEIKKGFEKVKKMASKEEKSLVKKDIKRDKKCEHAEKVAKKKKK